MVGRAFDRIMAIKDVATKADKKLIDGLSKMDAKELIYLSITELSVKLNVAEATIVRFCKKLGYRGFQDFKLVLSKELGTIDYYRQDTIVQRVAMQMADAIVETSRNVDYSTYLEIAKLIIGARTIGAFGVGNSFIAALEIGNVLSRIGINVMVNADPHIQSTTASSMKTGDVAILISVSGATKDIIDVAELAKKNGATTVVISCYDHSPLAKYADYLLNSTRREAAYEGGSVSSIVSISYLINILYNAVYESLGDEAYERTLRAATSVSNKSV